MSGIYISGMEMPKNCADCSFEIFERCGALYGVLLPGDYYNKYTERPEFCPLVAVPDHGRLIDADALMKILSKVVEVNASIEQRNEAVDQEMRCLWWFKQQIGIAPTIIEADKE